jgi:nitrogen fixation protein FixH
LTALARLVHPADARRDHALELTEISNGHYRGTSDAEAGQWDLIIDMMQNEERVFRSKSRIMLK